MFGKGRKVVNQLLAEGRIEEALDNHVPERPRRGELVPETDGRVEKGGSESGKHLSSLYTGI
jgi:hypothetical protein